MLDLSRLELLAPARDAQTGMMAIDHGADAVYIGGPQFGARQAAGNSLDDIHRLCEYAHRWHARVFLALNTLLHDHEVEPARALAFEARKAGVDCLIIQDMGLLAGPLPDMELHASTQCDIRTLEKALFLESLGFSQLVLARELSLEEVAHIAKHLTTSRIEYFIHGALCVSYSGQCYMSQAQLCRSANRGACAQLCRLPYDVQTATGDYWARQSHVLSLMDNDQTQNLEALIQAGVRSFKIEGRLKDNAYVKNVTAHYRKQLDAIIARHPRFQASSLGTTHFQFTPDVQKTFQRGQTEYFVHGRQYDQPYHIAQLDSPKNIGTRVARVVKVEPKRILVAPMPGVRLANGDGLTYRNRVGQIEGLAVNRVEELGNHQALYLRDTVRATEITKGTVLSRNRDTVFQRILAGPTAQRKIAIDMALTQVEDSLDLWVSDSTHQGFASIAMRLQRAQDTAANRAQIERNLSKLGETDYRIRSLYVPEDWTTFIPASIVNQLRRHAIEELESDRLSRFEPTHRRTNVTPRPYPTTHLDYRGNVANAQARRFYRAHGVTDIAPAFEHTSVDEADLMTCRHCIRAELERCPKMLKFRPRLLEKYPREAFRPDPLYLTNSAGVRFEAHFHCKESPCFMTIRSTIAIAELRTRKPRLETQGWTVSRSNATPDIEVSQSEVKRNQVHIRTSQSKKNASTKNTPQKGGKMQTHPKGALTPSRRRTNGKRTRSTQSAHPAQRVRKA